MSDECLPLVDANGSPRGQVRRSDAHGNPDLLHPVVHCLVSNAAGALLLQLRSRTKDVQPGRWDTSVGGHVAVGESIESAVVREIREELGIDVPFDGLRFLYRYVMRNSIESELVHTFAMRHQGPFRAEPGEIDELRFWTHPEIQVALGTSVFTPNFEDEFARYTKHLGHIK
jgi:isopentenyldiphosphate isomerase